MHTLCRANHVLVTIWGASASGGRRNSRLVWRPAAQCGREPFPHLSLSWARMPKRLNCGSHPQFVPSQTRIAAGHEPDTHIGLGADLASFPRTVAASSRRFDLASGMLTFH